MKKKSIEDINKELKKRVEKAIAKNKELESQIKAEAQKEYELLDELFDTYPVDATSYVKNGLCFEGHPLTCNHKNRSKVCILCKVSQRCFFYGCGKRACSEFFVCHKCHRDVRYDGKTYEEATGESFYCNNKYEGEMIDIYDDYHNNWW